MLKFQLATPQDLKVAANIERKRQIEEARKPRIFNPRSRRIGVSGLILRRHTLPIFKTHPTTSDDKIKKLNLVFYTFVK